jgi:nucleoside-diphosphate-sugar epimerase
VRARFQNVYGPREILGAGRWRGTPATVWRNVVPTFVYRAMKGMALELDNGGQATRDFVFVGDVVEGLIRCGEAGAPGDVYNLASGVETSIRELAATIVSMCGSDSELQIGPEREWDRSGHRFGSTAKSEKEIGFVASMGLEQGLRETIDWTTRHMDLIDAAVARHADRVGLAVGEPTVA